jgi:hypothetical protein
MSEILNNINHLIEEAGAWDAIKTGASKAGEYIGKGAEHAMKTIGTVTGHVDNIGKKPMFAATRAKYGKMAREQYHKARGGDIATMTNKDSDPHNISAFNRAALAGAGAAVAVPTAIYGGYKAYS